QELNRLQWTTVLYYLHETNPDNGLVRDKTDPEAPCSIAAVGLALATIPVIVERGVVIRKFAAKIARRRLRSLLDLPQGPAPASASTACYSASVNTEPAGCAGACELPPPASASLSPAFPTGPPFCPAATPAEPEARPRAAAPARGPAGGGAGGGAPTLTHGWRP